LHEADRGGVVRSHQDAAQHIVRHRFGQKLPAHITRLKIAWYTAARSASAKACASGAFKFSMVLLAEA
jgi:hypothetical protein